MKLVLREKHRIFKSGCKKKKKKIALKTQCNPLLTHAIWEQPAAGDLKAQHCSGHTAPAFGEEMTPTSHKWDPCQVLCMRRGWISSLAHLLMFDRCMDKGGAAHIHLGWKWHAELYPLMHLCYLFPLIFRISVRESYVLLCFLKGSFPELSQLCFWQNVWQANNHSVLHTIQKLQ